MPSFFVRKGRRKLKIQLHRYIENYIEYIRYVVRKRIHIRPHWDDMEQFIIMQLIKLYPKKFKYTDFDWVVRTAIRRKAIDFDAKNKRQYRNLVFENQFGTYNKSENTNLDETKLAITKSHNNWNNKKNSQKVVDFINHVLYKITHTKLKNEFTDWDREYLDVLLFLFNLGYDTFDKSELMECMGFDSDETLLFNSRLNIFRMHLKKYFSIELDLV